MKVFLYNVSLVVIIHLTCQFSPAKSSRTKRMVNTNDMQFQDNLVNIPADYGQDEEVESLETELSDSGEENDKSMKNTAIQIIQKSNTVFSKVRVFTVL